MRRDLLLLAAGLVLGIVLGPSVLGAVSPSSYLALFGGTESQATAQEVREKAVATREQARTQLGLGGEPEEGPQGEAREQAEANLARIDQALGREVAGRVQVVQGAMDATAIRWVLGLLVALTGVFVAEAMAAPEASTGRGERAGPTTAAPGPLRRLKTVRFAILSLGLAVILARPTLYEGIPWFFVAAVLAVSFAAAWVPLGRRSTTAPPAAKPAPAVNPPADRADGAAG